MFIILAVVGCFPNVNVMINEEGETLVFDTKMQAQEYAKENCAWEYKIIEW